ncbi:MAG: creatininase family protein [Thermofilum sp.]
MPARKLGEYTYAELKELLREGVDSAILPVGTLEPHGLHLPLATDTLIAEKVAELVAERSGALLLPALPYGVNTGLHGYPGSVRVEPDTLEKIVLEILKSLSSSGFRYVLVVNGHGGNTQSLDNAARRAWLEYRLAVLVVDWWVLAREVGLTKEILGKEGGHAATDETAAVLAFRPDLVKRELYSESSIHVYKPGVRAYPSPGTVINYSATEGGVEFPSSETCRRFLEAVAEAITSEFEKFREGVRLLREGSA